MKILRILIAALLALGSFASLASATTYTITNESTPGSSNGYFRPLPGNADSFAPGYEIVLPAFAQNDSCVVYLPFAPAGMYYLGWHNTTPTGGFAITMDLSAAADSVAVTPGIGQRIGGAFNSPFSAGLQVWTRTTATPGYQAVTATAATWFPGNIFRLVFRSKGATAIEVGRRAYVRFPRQFIPKG
jgi:hypothetical protein